MRQEVEDQLAVVLAGSRAPLSDRDWVGIEAAEGQGLEWTPYAPDGDEAPPAYTPGSTTDANWCMAMLRAVDEEVAAKGQQAGLWHDLITDWYHQETRRAALRQAFLHRALQRWGAAQRATEPSLRTMRLPSGGQVKATVPKTATVVVADEDRALAWLRACAEEGDTAAAEAIKQVPDSVRLPELRKLVKAVQVGDNWRLVHATTGTVLPSEAGLTIEHPGEARYTVVTS